MGNTQTYTIEGCTGCCQACSDDGANCGNCTDVDNSQYQVVFNGINLCACHASTGYGTDVKHVFVAGDVINTTHTLNQSASACVWTKTLTNAVDWYSGTGCVTNNGNRNAYIRLERKASTWELIVYADMLLGSGPGAGGLFWRVENEDGAGICATVPSFTINDNDALGCGSAAGSTFGPNITATGGSATVTCL